MFFPSSIVLWKEEMGNKLGRTATPMNIKTEEKCSNPRIFPARPVATPVNPAFFGRPNASFQPPVKDPYKASLGSVGGLLPGAHTCVDPATMRDAITGIY